MITKTLTCTHCRQQQIKPLECRDYDSGKLLVWFYRCPGCQSEYAAWQNDFAMVANVKRLLPVFEEDLEFSGTVVTPAYDILVSNPPRVHDRALICWT